MSNFVKFKITLGKIWLSCLFLSHFFSRFVDLSSSGHTTNRCHTWRIHFSCFENQIEIVTTLKQIIFHVVHICLIFLSIDSCWYLTENSTCNSIFIWFILFLSHFLVHVLQFTCFIWITCSSDLFHLNNFSVDLGVRLFQIIIFSIFEIGTIYLR